MARGLLKTVENVSHLFEDELVPVSMSALTYSDEVEPPVFQSRDQTEMGDCLERLSIGFYGGEHTGNRRRKRDDGCQEVTPDITDKRKRLFWECKGCRSGSTCNLITHQNEGYKQLQFRRPGYRILFTFFRHNLRGIRANQRNEGEIAKELSEGLFYSVVLPASAVFRLHDISNSLKPGERSDLVYPYTGSTGYDPCTCVRSGALNRFLTEPMEVLEEMDLGADSYRIERNMSPKGFVLDGNEVRQFPILRVFDRNHRKWVNSFIDEILPF